MVHFSMVKSVRAVLAVPLCAAALALCANPAKAVTWLPVGNDSGPILIITVNPNGSISTAAGPGVGPYDGIEDAYIGVINNSMKSISAIGITSPAANGSFGFDGDGIGAPINGAYPGSGVQQYGTPVDSTGYGGPKSFFTNISGGLVQSANVNFTGGLAAGDFTWFSLEGPATALRGVSATPLPATWSMMLIGFAGVGFLVYHGKKKGSAALLAAA